MEKSMVCRRRHMRHDPAEHWVMVCPLPRKFVHNDMPPLLVQRVSLPALL
jgi:hypothetical protein